MNLDRPSYEQLAALVIEQSAVIDGLRTEVVGLRAQVADLERRLAQNSRNSSRPPSSDGLAKPPAPKSLRRPSGRKPGGQPGHDGGHLAQVAVPDEVVNHRPSVCAGCQGDLRDGEDLGHLSRQVFDLPEIRLRVCEHRAHRRHCACGHETTGVFPASVAAATQYGPRVRALGMYLLAYQHLPYARASEMLGDWIGAPLSTGTLAAFMAQGAEDLRGFLDEIHAQLVTAPVAHFDETGARVQGRLRWLFCASTGRATYYSLHDKRGFDGLDHAGVLPHFTGTAVHDGFKPYRRYTAAVHALCKRGVIKQTFARNLIMRLDRDREQVLRFAHDFRVPFDNNLAERDLRMIKLQQKISGSWRTITGAEIFLALRSYLSTTRKNNHPTVDAITALAAHAPWLPAT